MPVTWVDIIYLGSLDRKDNQKNTMKRFTKMMAFYMVPFIMGWITYWMVATGRQRFEPGLQKLALAYPYICLAGVLYLGVHAAGTVLYRVATFNDCEDARAELIGEIEQAKKDLQRRGIQLNL